MNHTQTQVNVLGFNIVTQTTLFTDRPITVRALWAYSILVLFIVGSSYLIARILNEMPLVAAALYVIVITILLKPLIEFHLRLATSRYTSPASI